MEAVFVDIVSNVVTPSATRAGTAFGSIQNENLQILNRSITTDI